MYLYTNTIEGVIFVHVHACTHADIGSGNLFLYFFVLFNISNTLQVRPVSSKYKCSLNLETKISSAPKMGHKI
jgi:hypothetical protein